VEIEKLIWGPVPDGFGKMVDERGYRLLVRQDRIAHIDPSLWDGGETAQAHLHGRSPLRTCQLPSGETGLIRSYRHGGFFRALTGSWFFTWPPRPFRELAITEELRQRGFPTVEIYAACIRRGLGPFYRGWLVSKRLPGAEDLWSALQSGLVARVGQRAALEAVAQSVRRMHREGVYHSDLNLKNILLRVENGAVAGYIIDFDKAKLFLGQLPPALVEKNLARLLRSARKLDPDHKYLSAESWKDLVTLYHEARDA